ncbi:MAG: valine--tRNA ligase [Candidatus Aenigmarchaeota archaeon]|nr:valine--tRNA ligase [Candidatus Aenigmarchaeota archaeon]
MPDDKYSPKDSEPKWVQYWESEKIFRFDPKSKSPIYSIDTPPPTVSGKMHIGHAFSYTQQDIVARYKRMRGFNVFYPFGTDDNGLPTERLVEKLKNVKGARMERQEFIRLCEDTLKEIRPGFVSDWKRIGMSCDFDLFYSTINEHCRRISQESFLELHKMGRAYRKDAPALWCPLCATAISQVECEDVEKSSTFNDIMFKVDGKDVIIATTRPEMLPACVAVFAHPDDERYKDMFGKKAKVPLFNHEVPILADARADPTKGTGIVMCCTFGDQTDIAWYLAFNLPLKKAIMPDGKMSELAGRYAGLKIADARKAILEDLKSEGLLVKQKAITHAVKVHERCQTEIEIINSKQWFIKFLDLREDMLRWGAELKWHPDFMRHRYDNWVKGLQWDWLISRQRFFGVPFPVWYCKKCDLPVFADKKKLPVDPLKDSPPAKKCACGSTEFLPEKDVLDTWATSSMTPQIVVQLAPKTLRKKLFPMSLRPQAHEIISFWLFNTLVKSRLHYGVNPWKDVALSGYVTDPLGEKMSKSKGNVVEPQVVLAKFSADAMRFWAGGSKLGEDIPYQEKELVAGDKFVTKLWNAAKFAFMHLECFKEGKVSEIMDKWILSRLSEVIEESTSAFDVYEFSRAKFIIERFFWNDFCDNYLELIKTRLYEPKKPEHKTSAQTALSIVLPALLKLMAPITPFITEELYHKYLHASEKKPSIHVCNWPEPPKKDKTTEEVGKIVVAILSAVRKKKSEMKLSMKSPVKKLVVECKNVEVSCDLNAAIEDLKATCCAEIVEFGKGKEEITTEVKITVEL